MKGRMVVLLFALIPGVLFSQVDRRFIRIVPPWNHLSIDYSGMAHSGAQRWPAPGSVHWSAAASNHFGLNGFSSFEAGSQYSTGSFILGMHLKHSGLYDIGYLRNMVLLKGTMKLSDELSAGLLLITHWCRLPENLGHTVAVGGMPGLSYSPTRKFAMALQGGMLKSVKAKENVFLIHAGVAVLPSTNLLFSLDAESVSGTAPAISAAVTAHLASGLKICIGAGTGREVLKIGILFRKGKLSAGAITSFHLYGSRSYDLFLSGNHIMP